MVKTIAPKKSHIITSARSNFIKGQISKTADAISPDHPVEGIIRLKAYFYIKKVPGSNGHTRVWGVTEGNFTGCSGYGICHGWRHISRVDTVDSDHYRVYHRMV